MALAKSVNQQPATGALAVWNLVNLLTTSLGSGGAGWTKPADSDGTTYSSSGTQVTGGGSGAHGLANTGAWVRLRMPDGSLELTIQRGANNLVWRIKVSTAGFSGGSPSATQTPSATDEGIELGGGTDASPTYAQLIGASDGSGSWFQCAAQTATPYTFAMVAWANAANPPGYVHTKLILEPLQSWSLKPGSTFPYNVHAAGGSGGADTLNFTDLGDPTGSHASTPLTWLAKGTGSAGFVRMPACTRASDNAGQTVAPDGQAADPADAVWDLVPIAYERRSGATAPQGWKGFSSILFWRPSSAHKTGDLYTASTTGDCLVLNQVVMNLWGGDTPSGTGTTPATRSARLLIPSATDVTAPTVSNVSPTAGSAIGAGTALTFDVTDTSGSLRAVVVVAKFSRLNAWEVVHDGTSFGPAYSAGSTQSAITNGYHFSLVRAGGWVDAPTIEVVAIDPSGNEN